MRLRIALLALLAWNAAVGAPSTGLAQAGVRTLEENLTVRILSLDRAKGQYRVAFREKAAIYSAAKKFLPCLERSLKTRRGIRVSYDPLGLAVVECRP